MIVGMHLRPLSTLAAAAIIAGLAVPYARPAVCDAVHQHAGQAHERHDAGPAAAAVTDTATGATCHQAMTCGAVPVGPTLDRVAPLAVAHVTVHRQTAYPETADRVASAPLPPPPRS